MEAGDAAEFSTMVPHHIAAESGPVEILTILDHDGELAHLHAGRAEGRPPDRPAPDRRSSGLSSW